MIKKTAPFIRIYDEHGVGPLRRSGHALESLVKPEIIFAEIGVRMIVVARTVVEDDVSRDNERDRWQCSRAGGEERLFVGTRDAEIFHAL